MQGRTRQPETGTGQSQSPRAGKDQGSAGKEELRKNQTKQQNLSQTPALQPTPTPIRAVAGTAWDLSLLAWAGLGWQAGWHRLQQRQME